MALSVNSGGKKLAEIDESTGALLRFEGERMAAFVTSFNASDVASYRIVGTKGALRLDPAYEYAEGLAYELVIDGKKTKGRIGKRDQFAPELLYFSDCILKNREPEPSGEEGLQDVRIVQALYRSAKTGRAVSLPAFKDASGPARDSGSSDRREEAPPRESEKRKRRLSPSNAANAADRAFGARSLAELAAPTAWIQQRHMCLRRTTISGMVSEYSR